VCATVDVGARIDDALAEPAGELVNDYFDREGPFAADTFETLGDNPPTEISLDDLLALTTLGVQLKPPALRKLLGEDHEVVHRRLRQVPSDVDLWDASDEMLRSAAEFWGFLRALPGVDWVIAGKLGARKRPRLIPVLDSVTLPMLGAPSDHAWTALRAALTDPVRRERVEALRPTGISVSVSVIRLLDVALWMRGSESRNARKARVRSGLAVTPR
jgi:hypothetical protein